MHLKFGRQYLDNREYYARPLYRLRRYGVFLLKAALKLKFRDARFREHHRATLRLLVDARPGILSGAHGSDER